MSFWFVSCIVSAAFAVIIAFVLGAFWLADRADDLADYERQLSDDTCPWQLRHDELTARPDRITKFTPSHSDRLAEGVSKDHA